VQHIDTKNHEMRVRHSEGQYEMPGTGGAREATYGYDYLVLATGARLAPSDLSGLSEGEGNGKWHHFYSTEGAMQLRQALHEFEGGRIVVAVGGIPYRCPPARSNSPSCWRTGCTNRGCGSVQRFSISSRSHVSFRLRASQR
jgi:sulfide:quinone oxidoreductase